jgi:peptidyl-prolyl cis-trans isomerase B (cyclophilin B)
MNLKPKIAIIAVTAAALLFAGCASKPKEGTASTEGYGNKVTKSDSLTPTMPDNKQLLPPAAGDKIAIIETDLGTIKFKLFTEQVPEMTKNFEEIAKSGKYDGTPFHRVIKDFMIQTGDFNMKNGNGGYSYKGEGTTLPDEIAPSLKHIYGTVSMASHGKGTSTNGSQFFIVTNKNGTPHLDGSHSIFGQVYEGMDVAEQIAALQDPASDRPTKTVNMKKVTVTTYMP